MVGGLRATIGLGELTVVDNVVGSSARLVGLPSSAAAADAAATVGPD